MSNYNPIALIPHYNHAATVGDVARQLLSMDLPVLIVDDGSDVKNLTNLKYLEQWDGVSIVYCAQNGGKGTAVKIGFAEALKRGFTHVIQVDADGQHNISDTQRFIENHVKIRPLLFAAILYMEVMHQRRGYTVAKLPIFGMLLIPCLLIF